MYPQSQKAPKTQTKNQKNQLTNLQYNPHALQFNSSFNPLLQSGVCVAPQLLHSAFTPPGAVEDVELGRLPFVPAPGVVAVEFDPAPPKVFDAEPDAEEGPEPEPEPEVDEDEDPDPDEDPLSPDIPNPAPFKAGTLPDLGLPAPLPPLPPLLLLPLALEPPVKEER